MERKVNEKAHTFNSTLFGKVSVLLAGMMLLAAAGTAIGIVIVSPAITLITGILFLLGAFIVPRVARKSTPQRGFTVVSGWAFLAGMFIGPVVGLYASWLGWQSILLAFLGTAAAMAVCGAYGFLSGRDFSLLARSLWLGFLAIFVISIMSIFLSLGSIANIIFSSAGIIVFAGFFIIDFSRLRLDANNSWPNAILHAMTMFLNFMNLFLFVLRLLGALNSNDD